MSPQDPCVPPRSLLSPGSTVDVLAVGASCPVHFGVCVRDSVLLVMSPLGVTTMSDRNVSPAWPGPGGGGLWPEHFTSPLPPHCPCRVFLPGPILHSPKFPPWLLFPPQKRLLAPTGLWLSPDSCCPLSRSQRVGGFSPPPVPRRFQEPLLLFGFQTCERLS